MEICVIDSLINNCYNNNVLRDTKKENQEMKSKIELLEKRLEKFETGKKRERKERNKKYGRGE